MTNTELKKLKEEEVKILDYFVSFCEKHKLKYQLTYGTLLGAIRHKGFIPWDDDIDVHMEPKEYIKFLELVQKDKQDKYLIQNIDTEKYYHTYFTKIRKNNSCMVEKEWQHIKIHKGINIDIFPLFPYPDNKRDRKIMIIKLKVANLLASKNNPTKSIKNKIIFTILKLIPRNITNKISSKLIRELLTYNGKYSHYKIEIDTIPIKKEWVEKSIEVPFEKQKYQVSKQYDELLTCLYGDYMQLPKEEDRVGHGDIILNFNKNYEDITE